MPRDNQTRAEHARQMLQYYWTVILGETADEDEFSILGDVLADLRHYAEDAGVDFAAAVELSRWNFEAEMEEEGAHR